MEYIQSRSALLRLSISFRMYYIPNKTLYMSAFPSYKNRTESPEDLQ